MGHFVAVQLLCECQKHTCSMPCYFLCCLEPNGPTKKKKKTVGNLSDCFFFFKTYSWGVGFTSFLSESALETLISLKGSAGKPVLIFWVPLLQEKVRPNVCFKRGFSNLRKEHSSWSGNCCLTQAMPTPSLGKGIKSNLFFYFPQSWTQKNGAHWQG